MASGMICYKAGIVLTEEEMLLLIKTGDALDEIGAQPQAEIIMKLCQLFTRVKL